MLRGYAITMIVFFILELLLVLALLILAIVVGVFSGGWIITGSVAGDLGFSPTGPVVTIALVIPYLLLRRFLAGFMF
jgi:hypothetical protein